MITKTATGLKVTAEFGSINAVHTTPHTGVDVALNTGTELISPVDGVVERIMDYGSDNVGKGLVIRADNGDQLIFGHLSDWKVKVGEHIDKGDLVALSGNTGHSTGPHVHLGLVRDGQFADPSSYLDVGFNWDFSVVDWLVGHIIGDPVGVIAVGLFMIALFVFKPTRIFAVASTLIYILID